MASASADGRSSPYVVPVRVPIPMFAIGSRASFVITDMVSPSADTIAGRELQINLDRIRDAGLTCAPPLQGIDAFAVPPELLDNTKVFVVGSPAGHCPNNKRIGLNANAGNVRFKEDLFYSLCYSTPPDSALVMTYSAKACGSLEFWTTHDADQGSMRILVVAPAFFENYKPRRGLADSLTPLSDSAADTMIALYIPAAMAAQMHWRVDGSLDACSTIRGWVGSRTGGRIVSFGAYTAELELDLMGVH